MFKLNKNDDKEIGKTTSNSKVQKVIPIDKKSQAKKRAKKNTDIKVKKTIDFIRGKKEHTEEVFIEFPERKKYYATRKLNNPKKAKETIALARNAWSHYRRKFWKSYGLFLGLNFLIVIISSLMIIFNLYSLRWNTSETKEIIYYFIAIAIGSLVITFLTSIASFFSFYSKNEIYKANIEFLKAKLDQYKSEAVEDLHAFVNEIGKVDTDF